MKNRTANEKHQKSLVEMPDPETTARRLRLVLPETLKRVARIEQTQYVPQETWNFEFVI